MAPGPFRASSPLKKLSIGSWAYLFNQDRPTTDFHQVVHKLADMGYEGVELGGFDPHPNPDSYVSKAKRQQFRKMVVDHGLEFSALAADLWAQKLWSTPDQGPYVAAFSKNLFFAEDLGIQTIRVDTAEPIRRVAESGVSPEVIFQRCAAAFDLCAKLAANRGINVTWEFEPGFPLNKPSEIVGLARRVREDMDNPNFGVLFDTCHAHMCAAVGANQVGQIETLPGGALELLGQVKGLINHVHLIDSDGTLNEHNTSTHAPFGKGKLDFDALVPALLAAQVPSDWWCVDLCFWPNAWDVTASSKRFLDKLRQRYDK